MIQAGRRVEFQGKSPEEVERLRVECFCDMLGGLGLKGRVTWANTMYYCLTVEKPGWFYNSVIQTLVYDNLRQPKWMTSIDCFAHAAITSLYRQAFEFAVRELGVSLYTDEKIRNAVSYFYPNLAYSLAAFPHIRRYLNLYPEKYFGGGAQTPYRRIGGCTCFG